MIKIERSGPESGSISQRHGSADPDPDPHQNVMNPQQCSYSLVTKKWIRLTRQLQNYNEDAKKFVLTADDLNFYKMLF